MVGRGPCAGGHPTCPSTAAASTAAASTAAAPTAAGAPSQGQGRRRAPRSAPVRALYGRPKLQEQERHLGLPVVKRTVQQIQGNMLIVNQQQLPLKNKAKVGKILLEPVMANTP